MQKIYSIYFYLFSLLPNLCFGQGYGKPFIQNYTPFDYKSAPQNWCIVQDQRGIIYSGCQENGVLEFDGTSWQNIPTKNQSAIRSMAIDSTGKIYVGGVNEFGYLQADDKGELHYNSLTQLLDSVDINFQYVWSINIKKNEVYFQTDNSVFRLKNNKIRVWKFPSLYHRSFLIYNEFYIRIDGIGLAVLKNDTFQLVNNGEMFASKIISAMLPFPNGKILIGSRSDGLFLYDPTNQGEKKQSITRFQTDVNDLLKDWKIYHAAIVFKNNFALGTLYNGVVVINAQGEIVDVINKERGLNVNEVYFIHNQQDQSLWLGSSNGIERVDIGTPIKFLDETNGVENRIQDILMQNGRLYLATLQNALYSDVLYKDKTMLPHFEKVEGISENSWSLLNYNIPFKSGKTKLLVATSQGVYEITGNKATLVCGVKWSYKLISLKENPYIVIFAGADSLFKLKWNGLTNGWEKPKKLIGIPDVREIVEDDEHNLWCCTNFDGIYQIKFSHFDSVNKELNYSFDKSYQIVKYGKEKGLPLLSNLNVMIIDNKVYATSSKGFLRFDKVNDIFSPDTSFNKQIPPEYLYMYKVVQDSKGLWIDGRSSFIKQPDNSYVYDNLPFKRLNGFATKSIFSENDGVIWLGAEKLFSYNSNRETIWYTQYATIIRKVTIGRDSLVNAGSFFNKSGNVVLAQLDDLKPVLDYKYNSVTFSFSAPYFIEQKNIKYSMFLEGFDDSWTEWSGKTQKEYTNLPEGKYTFKVKAKNIYEVESSVASYEFTILPPWYRTIFAYLSYFTLFALIILLSIKIYTKRLKEANIHLEKIVKERTEEVTAQRDEIEIQKNAIEAQSIELAKLSIVASETDNAITIMDAEGNFEWFNSAYKNLFGYSFEEFIWKRGNNILKSSFNNDIKEIIGQCLENKTPVTYQNENISRSGEKIWTQTTISPILDDEGNIQKLISIEADIRKIKEYENKLLQKNEEIAAQRDALAEANTTKDKFFSIISHDLKSPFNSILGLSEILSENSQHLPKEKVELFHKQLHLSAKQVYNLVENLLEWSKTKTNRIKSIPEKLNLKKIADEVIAVVNLAAKEKNIEIENNIQENTFVYADPYLTPIIIRNLLSNAVKFSESSGKVTLNQNQTDRFIEISVSDSGVGMNSENISMLFREDVHISTAGTNKEKGTGLGLIICKEFVEKSGGKIWVESKLGEGTTFTFTLPIIA